MTPTRYRECLDTLGMSQRGLAPILCCSDRLPRAWATGREFIPPEVADWLEAWVKIRLAHPDPSPPESWSRNRSPTATADGSVRADPPPGDRREDPPTLARPDDNAHRNGDCQIMVQDQGQSMARNISDVLKEITTKLEQFGRQIAELTAACARADDNEKRVAHLIIMGFVRPAMTNFLRIINREVE